MKDQSDAFEELCMLIGVGVGDTLKPSVRAASFSSEAALCDPKVSSEWAIRSYALLAMLAHWAHKRRNTKQRQMAEGFLEIIAMQLGACQVLQKSFDEALECFSGLCGALESDGVCCHIAPVVGMRRSHGFTFASLLR